MLDGTEVLFNMRAGRRRQAYMQADPRVSLTILDGVDWHTHVSLQGRIVRMPALDGKPALTRGWFPDLV